MTYSRFCSKTFFYIKTQKGPAYTFFCRQHLFILPELKFFGKNVSTSFSSHTDYFFFFKVLLFTIENHKIERHNEEKGTTYRTLKTTIKNLGTKISTSRFLYIPLKNWEENAGEILEVLPTLKKEVLPTLFGSLSTRELPFRERRKKL